MAWMVLYSCHRVSSRAFWRSFFRVGKLAGAADQDAGAAGAVAVVVVGPMGQAAGVAVQKGVQLVVVVGACGRLAPLHQGGGLVHCGPVAGRGAAGL